MKIFTMKSDADAGLYVVYLECESHTAIDKNFLRHNLRVDLKTFNYIFLLGNIFTNQMR